MKTSLRIGVLGLALAASSFHMSFIYAENVDLKTNCFLTDQKTDGGKPGDPKDTFETQTSEFFAFCPTTGLKKGQSLTAVWFADDTHKVVPDNYKIQQKTVKTPDDIKDGEKLMFTFGLTKPTQGWPAGKYHVAIYVDDQKEPVQSLNFTVSANKTTE